MFTIHFPAAVFPAPAVLIPGHRSETLKRGLIVMAAMLAAFLALAFALLPASAETLTWNCGTSVTCTLEDDGKFTVSGEGPMTDYSFATYADWYAYRGQIQTVEIEEGVTTVGNNTFLNSARLNSVSIAGTVTSIG